MLALRGAFYDAPQTHVAGMGLSRVCISVCLSLALQHGFIGKPHWKVSQGPQRGQPCGAKQRIKVRFDKVPCHRHAPLSGLAASRRNLAASQRKLFARELHAIHKQSHGTK